jgi:hypothetical protein
VHVQELRVEHVHALVLAELRVVGELRHLRVPGHADGPVDGKLPRDRRIRVAGRERELLLALRDACHRDLVVGVARQHEHADVPAYQVVRDLHRDRRVALHVLEPEVDMDLAADPALGVDLLDGEHRAV